jgi:voltage-gated potassium channel
LSAIIAIQLALGLLTDFVEGWSVGDAVYFTLITGLTIGYGDLVPRQTLTRALAIVIGFSGLLVTGVAAHAMRSALTDGGSGDEAILIFIRDHLHSPPQMIWISARSGCGAHCSFPGRLSGQAGWGGR